MYLILDERETQLFDICTTFIKPGSPIILQKQVLHLGDAVLRTNREGDVAKDILIFERKSIRDLLASIKDGRYEEQSHRLVHSSGIPTHHILYLIEGMYSQTRTDQEKQTVYSAITSLNLFKGFSVLRTCSLNETAETLVSIATKCEREFKKGRTFASLTLLSGESQETPILENTPINTEEPEKRYCEVVKKVKKENITPENIGEIILSQIPGISATTAIAIMSHFSSFADLMEKVSANPEDALKNLSYTDSSGKVRKISATVLKNIPIYLLGKRIE